MGATPEHVPGRSEEELSLLDRSLVAALRDVQTVTPGGKNVRRLIEGVSVRSMPKHIDERGSVVEIYDSRWNWHSTPVEFAYCFTIRPGFVKGWAIHHDHEDRYCLLRGEMELVLFDPRPGSSTLGEVSKITLSEFGDRLINIPKLVWHAERNLGTDDVVVINLPTQPYNHENPDKYRLPIDTPLIPYSFKGAKGW